MQIMAIVAALLFCTVVLTLSGLVGLIFGGITATVIKGVCWQRRLALSATSALPFACLALIAIPFILRWVLTEKMSIPGTCRLPNGYSLMVINVADPVWVYNSRNESTKGSVAWHKDGVDGVRTLQIGDRYILGGRDSQGLGHLAKAGEQVDSYFVLDTQIGNLTTMPSLTQLQSIASQLGIQLKLERAYTVYSRYGLMQFARVPPLATLVASLILIWLLARWILQLRRFYSIRPVSLAT
jgi:hypothetical protein